MGPRIRTARQQPGQRVARDGIVGFARERHEVPVLELAADLLRLARPASVLEHAAVLGLEVHQTDPVVLVCRKVGSEPTPQRQERREAIKSGIRPAGRLQQEDQVAVALGQRQAEVEVAGRSGEHPLVEGDGPAVSLLRAWLLEDHADEPDTVVGGGGDGTRPGLLAILGGDFLVVVEGLEAKRLVRPLLGRIPRESG